MSSIQSYWPNFLWFFEKSAIHIDHLPNEIIARIFSHVPLQDHLACSYVCRRWKQILDSNLANIEYMKEIKLKFYLAESFFSQKCTFTLKCIKDSVYRSAKEYMQIAVNTYMMQKGDYNSDILQQPHITKSFANIDWLVVKTTSFIEKKSKIDSTFSKMGENIDYNFLRASIKYTIKTTKDWFIYYNSTLFRKIEQFVKDNIFISSKQFICLFSRYPQLFLRLQTGNIFEEPKHNSDDLDLKIYVNPIEKNEQSPKKDRSTEISVKIARGKWYVFLHGVIPETWYPFLEMYCNKAANEMTLQKQDQKAKKRALERKYMDDSEPLLKKTRNLVSYFFK